MIMITIIMIIANNSSQLPSTANNAANVMINVPANSNLTPNQQLALKFKKYAY